MHTVTVFLHLQKGSYFSDEARVSVAVVQEGENLTIHAFELGDFSQNFFMFLQLASSRERGGRYCIVITEPKWAETLVTHFARDPKRFVGKGSTDMQKIFRVSKSSGRC